jgi:hypothetical protein
MGSFPKSLHLLRNTAKSRNASKLEVLAGRRLTERAQNRAESLPFPRHTSKNTAELDDYSALIIVLFTFSIGVKNLHLSLHRASQKMGAKRPQWSDYAYH